MEIKNYIFIIVFLAAFAMITYNVRRLIRYMQLGQKENRFDNIGKRIKNVLVIAFGQTKLLRDPIAGTIHFAIFWGFMLFLLAVVESLFQGFYSPFNFAFLGPFYSLITLIQDIFGLFVIAAVIWALYRRYIIRIPRLEVGKKGRLDATVILLLILIVVVAMFGQNISLIALHNYQTGSYEIRPVSYILAPLFYSANPENAHIWYQVFWWIHIVAVLGFLNFLPYSKHLHVLASIPNVFFAGLKDRRNILQPLNLEDENAETFGASDIEQLTWKQMLDGYTCTECGRCTAACPAANTGKVLSPRKDNG